VAPAATASGALARGIIAFASEESLEAGIDLIHADGTGLARLADGPCAVLEHPAWSPDGTRIAYHCGFGAFDNTDTWVMNADGSNRVQLTKGGAIWPAWSPNGALIAFTRFASNQRTAEIRVMDDTGGSVRQVTDGDHKDHFPAWAPDGRILFLRDGEVFAVNPDGSGLDQLTRIGHLTGFALSPDGTTLAVSDGVEHRIVLVPANGGGSPVTLVDTDYGYMFTALDWSPDGRAIAIGCSDLNVSTGSAIHVVNADGSGLTTVPNTELAVDPAWAPVAP